MATLPLLAQKRGGLKNNTKSKGYVGLVQQAHRPTAAEPKPLRINPTIKTAYNANSMRANAIVRWLQFHGFDPNDPSKDATVLETAQSDYLPGSGRNALFNWATLGNYQAAKRAISTNPRAQQESVFITQARSGELFGEGGKTLTDSERREVEGLALDPGVQLQGNLTRAREQLRWIRDRQLGTQRLYPPDVYETLPDLTFGLPTPPRDPFVGIPGYNPMPPVKRP